MEQEEGVITRNFVVIGHRASTTGDFNLNDLAGGAGRLDVLLRCITSALLISNGIRKDTDIYLVLQGGNDPPKTLRIEGYSVRYLNPDERSTGALVRNALMKELEEGEEVRSTPGIYASGRDFRTLIEELARKSKIYYLKEDGEDIRAAAGQLDRDTPMTFVLGDDKDLTEKEENAVLRHLQHKPSILSLGRTPLHSDHCITIVHNELDRVL